MFDAELISLSDGQSYQHVKVCDDADLDKFGINKIFEDWTGCFFHEKKCYLVHHWKVKVIHLTRSRHRARGTIFAERLVLDGDILYSDINIIPSDSWAELGIPFYFVKQHGIAGQMAFSCQEGTFITHDTNCTSIIIQTPRKQGITDGKQPILTPLHLAKKRAIPDTRHGRILGGFG